MSSVALAGAVSLESMVSTFPVKEDRIITSHQVTMEWAITFPVFSSVVPVNVWFVDIIKDTVGIGLSQGLGLRLYQLWHYTVDGEEETSSNAHAVGIHQHNTQQGSNRCIHCRAPFLQRVSEIYIGHTNTQTKVYIQWPWFAYTSASLWRNSRQFTQTEWIMMTKS